MSDFFSNLVDRAAGRAPAIDRRVAPRYELPRGRSSAPESIAQDPAIQPAIEEIFQETRELGVAPTRPKAIEPKEAAPVRESKIAKPSAPDKPAQAREPRVEPKPSEPVRAIAKVERIVEPAAPRMNPGKPQAVELAVERKSSPSTPRDTGKPSQVVKTRAAAPAVEPQNRIAPAAARSVPAPAIQPKVTPRAPQVMVQRERSLAPTIQVTIGRIEVRAGGSASAASAVSRPAGPKLSLEDYLKNRGSR